MTVFYRHEWDENGKTRVLNSRNPEIYDGSYLAFNMATEDKPFKRLILNLDSMYRIGQSCVYTYADYIEVNAPMISNLMLPYVFQRLHAKNVVLNFSGEKLTTLAYICASSGYNYCALETCKITGAARATAATMAFANCSRLYSLRIDSLANCSTMIQFALQTIFDKSTVLHLRDLLVASTKTGSLQLGIADELSTDQEVQAALAEIRAKGWTVLARWNYVPYDLR